MEIIAQTRKIGGSLVVTLPKLAVKQEGLTVNQVVRVEIKKIKNNGFGLFHGIGPFQKESKFKGQMEE